jgi:Ribbon-helix-helix protein, copG family
MPSSNQQSERYDQGKEAVKEEILQEEQTHKDKKRSKERVQSERYDQGKEAVKEEILQEEQTHKDKKRSKERVQFDFSIDALERLDELKEAIGASTRAEVIRHALQLYEWFVSETNPSDTITLKNKDGELITTFKAKLLHSAMKSE